MKNGVFRGQCCDDVCVFLCVSASPVLHPVGPLVCLSHRPAERKKKKTVLVIE